MKVLATFSTNSAVGNLQMYVGKLQLTAPTPPALLLLFVPLHCWICFVFLFWLNILLLLLLGVFRRNFTELLAVMLKLLLKCRLPLDQGGHATRGVRCVEGCPEKIICILKFKNVGYYAFLLRKLLLVARSWDWGRGLFHPLQG